MENAPASFSDRTLQRYLYLEAGIRHSGRGIPTVYLTPILRAKYAGRPHSSFAPRTTATARMARKRGAPSTASDTASDKLVPQRAPARGKQAKGRARRSKRARKQAREESDAFVEDDDRSCSETATTATPNLTLSAGALGPRFDEKFFDSWEDFATFVTVYGARTYQVCVARTARCSQRAHSGVVCVYVAL